MGDNADQKCWHAVPGRIHGSGRYFGWALLRAFTVSCIDLAQCNANLQRSLPCTSPCHDSLNSFTNEWVSSVKAILDRNAPLVQVVTSNVSKPKPQPWITKRLQNLLQQRRNLQSKARRDLTNARLRPQYRAVRREGALLNQQLKTYLTRKVENCWKLDQVIRKVDAKLGAFRYGRQNLIFSANLTFYLSIIQSSIDYASSAHVHLVTSARHHRLIVTSHRGMKEVFGLDRKTPTRIVLQHTRLYPVGYHFNLKLYVLVYRCLHNLASHLICKIFVLHPHCCWNSWSNYGQVSYTDC